MSVYALKPGFQALLRPGVRALARRRVTPNQVTVAAAGLSVAGGAAILASGGAVWSLLALPAILLVRMALNAADGMLAREHGGATRLGAVLNEFGDGLSDAALYLPLAAVLHPGWPVVAAVAAGLLAELAGLAPVLAGGTRRYDGPFGKPDRATLFGALCLAEALVGVPPILATTALLAAALLGLATCVRRIRRGVS
jgi:CDP-diacylglycerol---glycerol-3-phosphate 3-phosphatidyltransferase